MTMPSTAPPVELPPCPVAATLDVVGPRSSFLVLREASFGTRRFQDFVARTGLSEPVTAGRLRQLVTSGLLERQTYQDPGQRSRDEYALTPKGLAMVPVLLALREWGERYALQEGPGTSLRHADCGAPVHLELRCEADHVVPPQDATVGRPGEPPGGRVVRAGGLSSEPAPTRR